MNVTPNVIQSRKLRTTWKSKRRLTGNPCATGSPLCLRSLRPSVRRSFKSRITSLEYHSALDPAQRHFAEVRQKNQKTCPSTNTRFRKRQTSA